MSFRFIQADATRLPLADASVDLVFGSPPYVDARLYLEAGQNLGISRGCAEWVEWMLAVTKEALRVTRGAVLWVAAGVTRDWAYWPACEGLMWEAFKQGLVQRRPCFWHRVGIPGSGGKDWFRADVEYVMAFTGSRGELPWSDNTAMGHPPKWAPGGSMSNRTANGRRVDQWGHSFNSGGTGGSRDDVTCQPPRPSHVLAGSRGPFGETAASSGARRADGSRREVQWTKQKRRQVVSDPAKARQSIASTYYHEPVKANPGTLVHTITGGGVMGHPLAHENEAPFPEVLARHFILSLCPPGGTVLDPFSGSGTTVAVAHKEGRHGIGCDLRFSQCELGRRRLMNPHAKKEKKSKPDQAPAASEMLLFDDAAA